MSNPASYEIYSTPLCKRYASNEMVYNFSEKRRIIQWRYLWLWLAQCEKDLGVDISDEQLEELKQNIENIDFEKAKEEEKMRRHDVMAHVHTFGAACPLAAPIIHLGATSCFIGDNADLIIMRQGLDMVAIKLASCIDRLSKLAFEHRRTPCLGRTHLQPAQPTTMGKRFCIWNQELLMDLKNIEDIRDQLKFRGCKGAVGSQATFLQLFHGEKSKVESLESLMAEKAQFEQIVKITGQTYTRKMDSQIIFSLATIGATVHKIGTDIRLLASFKEIDEPFEKTQIGSSAMPYKRNPIRSERLCSLGRFLMCQSGTMLQTQAVQWLERSLDDSAIRRIVIPEAFLAVDSCLILLQNIFEGLRVYPKVIARNLEEELPFMATESILMRMVEKGGNRQECHEKLRVHSQKASEKVKLEGDSNDLLVRIREDPYFQPIIEDIHDILKPCNFIGLSVEHVIAFNEEDVRPALLKYQDLIGGCSKIAV